MPKTINYLSLFRQDTSGVPDSAVSSGVKEEVGRALKGWDEENYSGAVVGSDP